MTTPPGDKQCILFKICKRSVYIFFKEMINTCPTGRIWSHQKPDSNKGFVHGKEKSWWGQGYRIGRNGIHLSCVTLGKLLKLSEPQLSCILNRHHNASLKMLQWLNEVNEVKHCYSAWHISTLSMVVYLNGKAPRKQHFHGSSMSCFTHCYLMTFSSASESSFSVYNGQFAI